MTHRRAPFLFLFALAFALSGCGGGGGSAGSLPAGTVSGSQAKTMALHFTGTGTLSTARKTLGLAGTPFSVSFKGSVVATGTLDATGAATFSLPDDIPAGATVQITAGTTSATTVLTSTAEETVVTIQVNPDGTLTVTSASPTGADNNSETEDHQGNPEEVNDDGNGMLPSNLQFTVSTNCTTITLTPTVTTLSRLIFEEKVEDSDSAGRFRFDGAFNAPQTFPIAGASARIHIIVFDQSGKQLVEVKAPINALTPTGSATAAPCPSIAPTASPTPH
jgi:hypothetical protein